MFKGIIGKIVKDIVKYMFILIAFIVILLVILYMFQRYNNERSRGWNKLGEYSLKHPNGWIEFEQNVQKKYGFIKNIEIYNNKTSIFIINISSKNMDLVEANDIFKETRNFLLSEEVFSSIEEYHRKEYSNDFYEIYIGFYNEKEDRNLLYQFSCGREPDKGYENFKVWSIHIPGQDNDLIISP